MVIKRFLIRLHKLGNCAEIDTALNMLYYPSTKIAKEDNLYGSGLLREMPQQEGDERSQIDHHEEREAGYTGDVS